MSAPCGIASRFIVNTAIDCLKSFCQAWYTTPRLSLHVTSFTAGQLYHFCWSAQPTSYLDLATISCWCIRLVSPCLFYIVMFYHFHNSDGFMKPLQYFVSCIKGYMRSPRVVLSAKPHGELEIHRSNFNKHC